MYTPSIKHTNDPKERLALLLSIPKFNAFHKNCCRESYLSSKLHQASICSLDFFSTVFCQRAVISAQHMCLETAAQHLHSCTKLQSMSSCVVRKFPISNRPMD